MKLSGWGRYPLVDTNLVAPRTERELIDLICSAENLIARGNGRSYGDSAVSAIATVHMRHFNHFLAFNEETGQFTAEAGVLLEDIISTYLPKGWFPSVTPGTKFVTLGGMIAADVHGKNHHLAGSFGSCVDWIDVLSSDGEIRRCSRNENVKLFEWTVGGMGLTGIILRAAIRLRPVETAWIRQETIPAPNLDAAMEVFEQTNDATYSVAWIDCLSKGHALGRSLVLLGEHAGVEELDTKRRGRPLSIDTKQKHSIPFNFPTVALNQWTIRAFNALYYWAGTRKAGINLVDWDSYFYPLDAILGWNRIYGRKGFAQFQCVLPLDQSRQGLRLLLEAISAHGAGSFLAVLKKLGDQNSKFSFPMQGYTLALDFPINKKTLALMNGLDQITLAHGGRFYLVKDSRMTAETLRKSDDRVEEFVKMRTDDALNQTFQSYQSKRLGL